MIVESKSPRVAIYARVSTQDQNLDVQLEELRDYCARRSWPRITIYAEKASGANVARTVLNEMMRDVRAGKIEKVIVHKIDRLGRSFPHFVQIVAEFRALHVGLIATSQGIDLSADNPMASLLVNFLAAIAEFSREMTVDRTRLALAHAKKKGHILGRPRIAGPVIDKILKLRAKKKSLRDIEKLTGISFRSVSNILKREEK